jgi:hypothetical protein
MNRAKNPQHAEVKPCVAPLPLMPHAKKGPVSPTKVHLFAIAVTQFNENSKNLHCHFRDICGFP